MRFLVHEAQRILRSDERGGVSGFEKLLGSVALSGAVPAVLKDDIWEMHHTRNLILHRGCCADGRFVEACPKLGLKVGDRLKLSHQQMSKYIASLLEYAVLVADRIYARYQSSQP